MITSEQFDKLVYSRPFLQSKPRPLKKIVGFDSETLIDGSPFMFCTSYADVFSPKDLPAVFFTPKYTGSNFVLYNMRFDAGAILRVCLSHRTMFELWQKGTLEIEEKGKNVLLPDIDQDGYIYKYIPHKQLKIIRGKERVTFWDISQFYQSSLDAAARKYLNREKLSIATKHFTQKYVNRFHKAIARYCIQDAVLTRDLALHFIGKLKSFKIQVSNLYSCASISYQYFLKKAVKIVTVYDLYRYHPALIKLACDAYEGGKFEVTSRGHFSHVFEYDIVSAYPAEISRLLDLSDAEISYSPQYQPLASYGFIQCKVYNVPYRHLPCGLKDKRTRGVRIYPAGEYYTVITKREYEYLLSLGVRVEIVAAAWVFIPRKRYPYKNIISGPRGLFSIKDLYKKTDPALYHNVKVIMNGYYGKTAQVTELADGTLRAGAAWNPIHAAEITANTRIAICRMQNVLGPDCLAVHTDSVVSLREIPPEAVSKALGSFSYEREGAAWLIACGMYQIGDAADGCAFKGFNPDHGVTWKDILTQYARYRRIPYRDLHVESWIEAMAKNHTPEVINIFARRKKVIDLNCDTKRVWLHDFKAGDFLEKSEESMPKFIYDHTPPKYWEKIFTEETQNFASLKNFNNFPCFSFQP